MLFHIYNIEQRSDSEVYIYGKPHTTNYVPMQTVKVIKIISPVYFLPSDGTKNALISDLKKFTTEIKAIEEVKRTNIFHKAAKKDLELLRVHLNKRISFDDFDSEWCEMMLTEFSNPVENLIISHGLRGPCLVDISLEKKLSGKETVVEYDDIKFVQNVKFPEMKTCAVVCETTGNNISKFVYFDSEGIVRGEIKSSINNAEVVCRDPKDLLFALNNIIKSRAPDVVLFHNLHLKSKLLIKERIHCDIFSFASGTVKGRDFSIEELASLYKIPIGATMEWQAEALVKIFESMHALSLAKEMAEISGYILNKCLGNSRSERIEYTILHELYSRNYLFPIHKIHNSESYTGGLVLEPKNGFYSDIVLLLDFNSLYPSVIQEYNVCFSTVGQNDGLANREEDLLCNDSDLIGNEREETILPRILGGLVKRRKNVKDALKNCKIEEERITLDIRQKALKLTANSMYGCLGSNTSRFCNYAMASYITAKGRALLTDAKGMAESMGLDVIYGDTDSIMIKTKYPGELGFYDKAVETATELVDRINRKYRNIEIEMEKAFKKLLLYTKKKYAALVFNKQGSYIESKGLDLLRRDFCRASTSLLKDVLNVILEDKEIYTISKYSGISSKEEDSGILASKELAFNNISNEDKSKNSKVNARIYDICTEFSMNMKRRPVDDFVISSVLSKDLNLYSSSSNLPHVLLAIRLQKDNGIIYRQDDVVSYVIGAGDGPISSRSFHPEEKFILDYDYYIKNQILPSLYRLLSLIPEIHMEKIGLIFGSKEVVPKLHTKSITFITDCCQNVQEPSLVCLKCNTTIKKSFYLFKIHEMLTMMCKKMYQSPQECLSCGLLYYNHLTVCYECNKPLKFESFNEEFDKFLTALEKSFRPLQIKEIDQIIYMYSSLSSYRSFDMNKYFKEEVEEFKRHN